MATCPLQNPFDATAFALQGAGGNTWAVECINRLNWATLQGTLHGGLVGHNGVPVSCLTNATWGVTKAVCDEACSYSQLAPAARFGVLDFVQGVNNFFLFWMALTAQLPYSTGGLRSNFMALFLAVGSPALITFSLCVTISNRRWAKGRFDPLAQAAAGLPEPWRQAWMDRAKHEKFFLEEAQQEPLRVDDAHEFVRFVSSEPSPDGPDSWKILHDRLRLTRCGFTASLVAQTFAAIIAWVLTIVASFLGELGNIDAALQTAAGTIWMWMVPVVSGWVLAGVQDGKLAVEEALQLAFTGFHDRNPFKSRGSRAAFPKPMRANTLFLDENGNISQPRGTSSSLPSWWTSERWRYGPDAHGDGIRHGPLYNYARAATWWQLARSMEQCVKERIEHIGSRHKQGVQSLETIAEGNSAAVNEHSEKEYLDSTSASPTTASRVDFSNPFAEEGANSAHIELAKRDTRRTLTDGSLLEAQEARLPAIAMGAYPRLFEFVRHNGWRLVWPAYMASFIQVGTTVPAFIIAISTPPVGLGCSSGSYLIYGIASFSAWFLCLGSTIVSHVVRNQEQTREATHHSLELRTTPMSVLSWIAFVMLWSGKVVAVANCWWLIVSTLFELCGYYNTCFCYSSFVGLGRDAWVVLFKSDDELRNFAQPYWVGAMSTAGGVWIVSIGVFGYLAGQGRFWRWWRSNQARLLQRARGRWHR